jgi:Ser/Thr protein kinase RdoA (MazF antagonist)
VITTVPAEVLSAYGFEGTVVTSIPGGLINPTFQVEEGGKPRFVLQRLHPIFQAEVNLDIDAVTRHLAGHGLTTPRIHKTKQGELFTNVGGHTWRALTFIPGLTLHRLENCAQAENAGDLVGRFHLAVSDLRHSFAFRRAGVHDTARHLQRLQTCLGAPGAAPAEAVALGKEILEAARGLSPLAALPERICHGDLKVSNIRFGENRSEARCLIDLDTLGHMSIAYEMGDALRSWCNPRGEDETRAEVDLDILSSALGGYLARFGAILSGEERASIADGLETVCIELAARFCRDVFEDTYFGWDSQKYKSRKEHNLIRARGQLALGLSVHAHRAAIRRSL